MDSSNELEQREKLIQENLLLLKYKVQEQRLEKVWGQFESAGFQPILIKGWASALNYPNPAERLYVDLDLVFEPEDFVKAKEFILKNRFDLAIDLHKGARHLDSLKFAQLYQNSVIKLCGAAKIRVPCEEDHLRILCTHWLNDGGSYKDRLWDIYYAVDNRQPDFDWDKCLNVVNKKRRFWVICAIGLAHHYLDLPINSLPFRNEFKDIPGWVFRAIEKEWADDVRLLPLRGSWHDKKRFWEQIKKRIPPNPIQATIEVNGSFNRNPRFFYQLADIIKRLLPWWDEIRGTHK